MKPEDLKTLVREVFTEKDAEIKAHVAEVVGPIAAEKLAEAVKEFRIRETTEGATLSAEQKKMLAEDFRRIAAGEKSVYLSNSDQAGGYLVPTEVSSEIMRIAATVGIAARDARILPMGSDELELPIYTGDVMQGAFQGQDQEGSTTQNDIGVARVQARYWATFVRLSNILLDDANVNVADWIMSLIAEGLAYRMDREVFMGGTFTGSPFVGLLNTASGATLHTMSNGNDRFDELTLPEASTMIGLLDTSQLNEAAFYMHRTVWAALRTRSTNGVFEYGQSNLASQRRQNGIQPAGEILGYPVYTLDVLPTLANTAISTRFAVFANLRNAVAIGERGPMQVARSTDATIGGKNLFAANQTAYRVSKRWGVTPLLPAAAVVARTAAG
jgi:HK97 family phage major capsid protein